MSQDRTRFKDHDSNLDLTYITDTLIGARCFAYGDITRLRVSHASYAPFICFLGSQFVAAMGYPASGLESAWRNHIDEVCSYTSYVYSQGIRSQICWIAITA